MQEKLDELKALAAHFKARSETYWRDSQRWRFKDEELSEYYDGKAVAFAMAAAELEEML